MRKNYRLLFAIAATCICSIVSAEQRNVTKVPEVTREIVELRELVKNKDERAIDLAQKLAKSGDSEAMYLVYELQRKVDVSQKEKLQASALWLKKSAELNYAPAMLEYANLITPDHGAELYGFTEDLSAAFKFTEKASNQGYSKALISLGIFYAEGRGTPVDMRKAFYLFDKYEAQTGEKSVLKNWYLSQEAASRVGRSGCLWLGNMPISPKRSVTLVNGEQAQVSVFVSVIKRSDSYDKVLVHIDSIQLFGRSGKINLPEVRLNNRNYEVGKEFWDSTQSMLLCD